MKRLLVYILTAIIIILLTSAICSCSQTKLVPVETIRIDSISIRDTLFDVKLVPYKDSVASKDTNSYLSNAYAYSWARYANGILHHSLGIFPLATTQIKVPYFIDRYRYIEKPTIVEVEKKLTTWQSMKIKLGEWMIGIILLLAALLAYKLIRR